MTTVKPKKKQKLRNAEYFDLQDTFDKLYSESKKSKSFTSLMDIVAADENIMLAYRNISKNKGSRTAGTDGKTIRYLSGFTNTALINYVKRRLYKYQPQPVRRVEIPKGDTGKTRPLGIPTISDRLTVPSTVVVQLQKNRLLSVKFIVIIKHRENKVVLTNTTILFLCQIRFTFLSMQPTKRLYQHIRKCYTLMRNKKQS